MPKREPTLRDVLRIWASASVVVFVFGWAGYCFVMMEWSLPFLSMWGRIWFVISLGIGFWITDEVIK